MDNRRESKWCNKFKSKNFEACQSRPYSSPIGCGKRRKKDHLAQDCSIRGPICFECREGACNEGVPMGNNQGGKREDQCGFEYVPSKLLIYR